MEQYLNESIKNKGKMKKKPYTFIYIDWLLIEIPQSLYLNL